MVYNPNPPYEILQTSIMDLATIQRLRRFARYWDMVGNSGNFVESSPLIWHGCDSAFHSFLGWVDWLYARVGRTDGVALPRLMEFLFQFLTVERGLESARVALSLWRDYQRAGRSDRPVFLKPYLDEIKSNAPQRTRNRELPRRQARHLN